MLVPGMGSMTGERRSSQASETTAVETLRAAAIFSTTSFALRALRHRAPGQEGDAVGLAVVEHEIPLAIGEAVAVLHADDGHDFLRALDVLERDVGKADVADLALLLESRHGFHRGVEGDGRIGDVELVDVDALEAQALEAAFDGLLNVRGAGVVLPDAGAVAHPAGLGGDDQAGGIGPEGFGDQFFRDIGAVGVGSVNEVDAEFDGAAQRGEWRLRDRRAGPRCLCR